MGVSTMSEARKMKKKLPVTLLSGFLGSGKTTLLQHILRNKDHGLRCAVIVNDMAEVNIDGAIVANNQLVQREEKLVQMQNGCICCTLRVDLLEEINRLAADGRFDYLIIESTGVSEPMQVAETFTADFSENLEEEVHHSHDHGSDDHGETLRALKSLSESARLDTCVTTVDASSFYGYFNSSKFVAEAFDDAEEEDEKTVVDLLVDQIEFADVILLNKLDMVAAEQADKIREVLKSLNKNAKIIGCKYSKVDVREILNTGLFDMEKAVTSSGWLNSLHEEHKPETIEYGISSFIYRQRRPFHPGRLYDLVKQALLVIEIAGEKMSEFVDDPMDEPSGEPEGGIGGSEDGEDRDVKVQGYGKADDDARAKDNATKDTEGEICFKKKSQSVFKNVLRSKGFLWIAGKDEFMADWSQAGIIVTVSNAGNWFVDRIEELEQYDEDTKKAILKDFDHDNKIGDRRQEIVFIGDFEHEKEKEQLKLALDSCLLQEKEEILQTKDPWDEWY